MLKVNSLTGFGGKKSGTPPIEYVGGSWDRSTSNTDYSVSLSVPSGTADGDLMILRVGKHDGIFTPAGWTLWVGQQGGTAWPSPYGWYMLVYYKYASNEGSTVSFTALDEYAAALYVYKNAVPSTGGGGRSNGDDLTISGQSITVDGTWGLTFWENANSAVGTSSALDYDPTVLYNATDTANVTAFWTIDTQHLFPDGSTTTGAVRWSNNSGSKTTGISVTIKPAE
jgi:hypothetical protein